MPSNSRSVRSGSNKPIVCSRDFRRSVDWKRLKRLLPTTSKVLAAILASAILLTGCTAQLLPDGSATGQIAAAQSEMLTTDNGTQSADGSTAGAVAFVRDGVLYMQAVAPDAGEIVVEQCSDMTCRILYPKWSPDGSRLLYYRQPLDDTSQAEVRIATRDGQTQIVARDAAPYRPADWSPDGDRIVYLVNTERFDPSVSQGEIRFLAVWTAPVDQNGQSQDGELVGEVRFGGGCGGGGRSNSANVYEVEGGFAYGYLAAIVEWTPADILLYSNNCSSRGVGRFDMAAGQEMEPYAGDLRSLTLDDSGTRWAAIDSENQILLGGPEQIDYRTLDNVMFDDGPGPERVYIGQITGKLYYTTIETVEWVDMTDNMATVGGDLYSSPYFDFTQPSIYGFDETLIDPKLLWQGDGYAYRAPGRDRGWQPAFFTCREQRCPV